MIKFLIITPDKTALSDFAASLEKKSHVEPAWAESGKTALDMLAESPVDLVVADESLGDMTGLEFAEKLIKVNPLINCAVVSPLAEDEFHEASEGLGVVQLPKNPGKKQADDLVKHLENIKKTTAGINV